MTENSENGGYALLGDSPVIEAGRGDLLAFANTAKVLAGAAIETADPLTIGIFGEWGSGKTSLMRLIKQEVEKDTNVAAIWFNAWQYEREQHLIVPLVATITKDLNGRTWSGALAKGAEKLARALRSIAYGFSVQGKVGIPLISEAEVNLSGKDMIERYQSLAKDSMLDRSLYFDAFEELAALSGKKTGSGKNIQPPRIVVFVDDLDRCNPERAVELLEHIKLVLHQPGFAFVLGVHADLVETVIREKYAKEYNILDTSFAKNYLHKIAQVQIHVPKRGSDDMTDYIRSLLDAAPVECTDAERDSAIPLIAEAADHNPRSIVRLLNGMIVTLKIGKLDGNDYDLLALVIEIATQDKEFKPFRRSLGIVIHDGDDVCTIGEYLAKTLNTSSSAHADWADQALKNAEGLSPSLSEALRVLKEHESLCMLLRSDAGQRWLTKEKWREGMGQSLKQAGAEREQPRQKDSSDPIQQLISWMTPIPGGSFTMGDGTNDDSPPHAVTLDAFSIASRPVTQAQYESVMGTNPSQFKGSDLPVECVSWNVAMVFCEQLTQLASDGQWRFTLPTEAQWEYACRAGSTTVFCFGDDEEQMDLYAWYDQNSEGQTHPVGQKKPNAWGLYDMHGNVWEWCQDGYDADYYTSGEAMVNPQGPKGASGRVVRGGSWRTARRYCRSAVRRDSSPDGRDNNLGFRVIAVWQGDKGAKTGGKVRRGERSGRSRKKSGRAIV